MDKQADRSLNEALQRFERRLETPVVPGELADWIRSVTMACLQLGEPLERQVQQNHKRMLDEMARQDAGLLHRIEELQQEDEGLRREYEELRDGAQELAREADRAEPHEARFEERIASFVRRGLDLVIRVRTQETALETWFMESFDRDRGVAD